MSLPSRARRRRATSLVESDRGSGCDCTQQHRHASRDTARNLGHDHAVFEVVGDGVIDLDAAVDWSWMEDRNSGSKAGATFCGHTHIPFRHSVGQQLVFNVGPVGYPYDGDRRASYFRAMTTPSGLREAEFRRVSYSTDRVLAQVEASELAMRETLIRRLRFAVR